MICGHVAQSRIKAAGGALEGHGMALAGLIMGYAGMAVFILIMMMIAIAVPSFVRARDTSRQNACINNLRHIEIAKDQYALEHELTNGAAITFDDIGPAAAGGDYLKQWPRCPASTSDAPATRESAASDYEINPVGSNAACKVVPDKHVLP